MRACRALALLLTICGGAMWADPHQTRGANPPDGKDSKPKPKVALGKETTYVEGPLDKYGYIDYETALNERLGKSIKPDTNANVLLWKALGPKPEGATMPPGFWKWLGLEAPPEKGQYFVSLDAYTRNQLKLDEKEWNTVNLEQEERARRRPWTAKDYPHLARWLEANRTPLTLVAEAVKRPDYFNPLVVPRKADKEVVSLLGALLPGVQQCRGLAAALTCRALLQAGEGKLDAAWQDLLACHRLGRLVARGATLIEALVGIAIDQVAAEADLGFLDRAGLTAKQVQSCLQDLQDLPPLPPMADKIDLGERFIFLDAVQVIRRGGPEALGDRGAGKKPTDEDVKAAQILDGLDWAPVMRNGNRLYSHMAAALRVRDRAEREQRLAQIEEGLKVLPKRVSPPSKLAQLFLGKEAHEKQVVESIGNVLLTLLVPALRKVSQAYDRSEQVQRNLHIAFALAAYRGEHGRYPEKLAALAPRYLREVPDDLFTGGALVYRPADKGYLLYSVGANGRDEGGRWRDDDPPGDDLAVRMPPPELKPGQRPR
jgi:hypothetical protein